MECNIEVLNKWNREFSITDESKEELHYNIFKDFLKGFNLLKKNVVLDNENEIQIKERVVEKTKDINNKLMNKDKEINRLNQQVELMEEKIKYQIKTMYDQNKVETETMKTLIEDLKQDKIYLKKQLEILQTISEKINNKSESSYAKGVEGEKDLLSLLREDGSFKVEDTHGQSHKGDALITYNNRTYCIDSKGHTQNVPSKEVTKLSDDIKLNGYDGGAIIAWKAPIYDPSTCARIKEVATIKMMGGKPVLFISYANKLDTGMIISLLKMIEQHIGSSEEINNILNYDKLYSDVISLIDKEEKILESEHNSHMKRHTSRKNHFKLLRDSLSGKKEMSDKTIYISDPISEIVELIKKKTSNNEDNKQRNSTRDVKSYFEEYCGKHNKELLDSLKKVTINKLNDILENLGYKLEKKYGKNYKGKKKDSKCDSWLLYLSPDHLNEDIIN
tara:strand:+ start:120 stop:1460 length:1341 start_codon:yes stop_codon:yes gene_type:complete